MIYGIDVSKWQKTETVIKNLKGKKFVICKASEGKTLQDIAFEQHIETAEENGIELFGAYHYAKTYNAPSEDADNFLLQISSCKQLGESMLLALDFEGADAERKNAVQWALEWLQIVEKNTGIKPLIYTNSANTKKLAPILANDNGLWVAHYGVSNPRFYCYPFWAIWQYTSKPIDTNIFNGNVEQYLKYCKHK